jgi:PAS domain S-box-containing protein
MHEKLLLVDDEKGIRRVLEISLADKGYTVVTAKDGQEALAIFREHLPSIVLTDIKMPGMDGIQLLKRIKAEVPDTEVIMITGHGDMDLAVESLKNEATDFILKPIDNRMLDIALKRAKEKIAVRDTLRSYTEKLEERVTMTQIRFRQLFDESPCYISVQDRSLKIVETNRRFKEDFGAGTGVSCFAVYKHRDEPCDDCPVVKTFGDGKSHTCEMEVTTRSGTKIIIWITTAPIADTSGNIREVIEMATNITPVRVLQSHLSSLGLMISSVSHGIKGLITGLEGGVYMLKSGISRNHAGQIEEGMNTVALIKEQIKKLTLDILYYAREKKISISPVEMSQFAEDVARVIQNRIGMAQGILFQKEIDPALGIGEIDAGIVHSALINIFENAIEAVSRDMTKTFHLISFKASADSENIFFDVIDNGVGMDRETVTKLFTPDFSFRGSPGTGLGLFVSNEIIRQHAGTIMVESSPLKGSRFRIQLPRKAKT